MVFVHYARIGVAIVTAAATAILLHAAQPDSLPATGGDITILPINHATLQLRHAAHVIDVDPVAQASFAGLQAPDIILVTDIHGDHLDPAMIAKLKTPTTTVVAPARSVSSWRRRRRLLDPHAASGCTMHPS